MTSADAARATVVLFVVLVVQVTLLDAVRVDGAHPDAMLLVGVAAGYWGGPDKGAGFGFCAGLLADLFLPTTFGLSALVYCLAGYGTGLVTRGLVRNSWWLPLVVAGGATAAGLTAYAILGAVLGHPGILRDDLVPALVVATPAAVVLATPVWRLVAWAVPPVATGRSPGVGAGTR